MLPIGNGSAACGLEPGPGGPRRAPAGPRRAPGEPRAGRGQSRAHYNHEHLYLLGLTDD